MYCSRSYAFPQEWLSCDKPMEMEGGASQGPLMSVMHELVIDCNLLKDSLGIILWQLPSPTPCLDPFLNSLCNMQTGPGSGLSRMMILSSTLPGTQTKCIKITWICQFTFIMKNGRYIPNLSSHNQQFRKV